MLFQLFKIMWHRKGKNLLMLVEIFFSFIVLFVTSTLIFSSLDNYFSPIGFDYKDVYVVSLDNHGESGVSALDKINQIRQVVQDAPEIASFSFTFSNTPFAYNVNNRQVRSGDRAEVANKYVVEAAYLETMDLELKVGRWLEKTDLGQVTPIVVNEELGLKLFPNESPLGKRVTSVGDQEGEIVGIIKHFRSGGEFSSAEMATFQVLDPNDSTNIPSEILIEVKPGVGLGWQSMLLTNIGTVANEWSFDINSLSEKRVTKAKFTLIPIFALMIVCAFLIFNVALGLFGVLYHNINKRFAEIGIRRALGATKSGIHLQMLLEMLILTSFSLFLGLLFVIQLPLLGVFDIKNEVYYLSIPLSLAVVYLLVAFCAWYPSQQASKVEPAIALHFE